VELVSDVPDESRDRLLDYHLRELSVLRSRLYEARSRAQDACMRVAVRRASLDGAVAFHATTKTTNSLSK
jgi:hypothetical protein